MDAHYGDFATSKFDNLVNWARKFSLFQYPFVTACCGMEYMAAACSHYDMARFGAEIPRFSPRQADVLWVVGTITHKMTPILKTVYDQMADPKWVISFGACASSGGFYQNYSVLQGIDRLIPVDVYIAGCPPRPEAVYDGILELQEVIQHQGPKAQAINPNAVKHKELKNERMEHYFRDVGKSEVAENVQNPKSNRDTVPGFEYDAKYKYHSDFINLNPHIGYDSPQAQKQIAALTEDDARVHLDRRDGKERRVGRDMVGGRRADDHFDAFDDPMAMKTQYDETGQHLREEDGKN